MFEVFPHTADLGLRVRGKDLDTLFAEAGRGFFSVIVANLAEVGPTEKISFRVEGQAPDYLLVDFLSELLFIFDTQRIVLSKFDVHLRDEGLDAEVRGEPLDPQRHQLEHEIKAVTYHGLRVEQETDGWLAEVILDI